MDFGTMTSHFSHLGKQLDLDGVGEIGTGLIY